MIITWYGHAAFLIEGDGKRIIMDPYSSTCGFDPINDHADIVTISHENEKYHSCTSELEGDFELVNGLELGPEGVVIEDLQINAVEVYEDDEGNGPNAIVTFELEDIKIAHLGDLGHALTEEQFKVIEGCDILLALAGGSPTLNMTDLADLIKKLKPAIVIPMHFKCGKLDLPIHDEKPFLDMYDESIIDKAEAPSLVVTKSSFSEETRICLLQALKA